MSGLVPLPIYLMHEHVVFPHMVFPLFVDEGRIAIIEEALHREHTIGLLLCRVPKNCRPEDLHPIGTLCDIRQMIRMPGGVRR